MCKLSRFLLSTCLLFLLSLGCWQSAAFAALESAVDSPPDLARQPQTELTISLGNKANDLKFFPENLAFESGKRYKLILTNPSSTKHYFTAKDFADNIWSQKVDAGKVEIKGAIHELELKPGAQAEWVFVPIKAGTYTLRCPIPGHSEAGMLGRLTVTAPASSTANKTP